MLTGFYSPTPVLLNSNTNWLYYGSSYFTGLYHLGCDLGSAYGSTAGSPVYAVAPGWIRHDATGLAADQAFMWVEFQLNTGGTFFVVYGHVSIKPGLEDNEFVNAGEIIGHVKNQGSNTHTHFGVRPSGVLLSGWGRGTLPANFNGDVNTLDHRGFVAPYTYLMSHSPPSSNTSVSWSQTMPQGIWYNSYDINNPAQRLNYTISGGAPHDYQEYDWVTGWESGIYQNNGGGFIGVGYAGVGWHEYDVRTRRNSSSPWVAIPPPRWSGGWDPIPPGGGPSGGPPQNTWVNGAPSVSWTATDAHSGVRKTRYWWGGNAATTIFGANGSASLPEGENVLTVVAEDNTYTGSGAETGNTTTIILGTYRRDSQFPSSTVSITGTQGTNGWYTAAPTATVNRSDPAPSSGVNAWYTVNGGAPVQYSAPVVISQLGQVPFTYYARDGAGNQEAAHALTLKIDTTAPPPPVLVDEGNMTSSDSSLNVVITGGQDPESGTSATEYSVGDSDNPTRFRGITSVNSGSPFLEISGLTIPAGTNVIVRARTTNGAGVVGPWANTDGILVDPAGSPIRSLNYLFSSFGGHMDHPDIRSTSAVGEPLVGPLASSDGLLKLDAGFMESAPLIGRVAGTLTLNDYTGTYAIEPGSVEVWQGNQFVVELPCALNSAGAFQLTTGIEGAATLRFHFRSGLRKSYDVTMGASVTVVNAQLVNGDVDQTGEVDAADIDEVIADFGGSGGAGYPYTDTDGSGEVDAGDIDIVIGNFGSVDD